LKWESTKRMGIARASVSGVELSSGLRLQGPSTQSIRRASWPSDAFCYSITDLIEDLKFQIGSNVRPSSTLYQDILGLPVSAGIQASNI